jgi:outer membrane protein assembly factor BamB
VKDGVLYVGSSDAQRLHAIDARRGSSVWTFDTDGSAWSSPAVTDRTVYIGTVGTVGYMADHRGGFFAVDRQTGRERWRVPMGEIAGQFAYGVASSPAVANGRVFFGGLDGKLYACPDR